VTHTSHDGLNFVFGTRVDQTRKISLGVCDVCVQVTHTM
jgi:hypothetical protein